MPKKDNRVLLCKVILLKTCILPLPQIPLTGMVLPNVAISLLLELLMSGLGYVYHLSKDFLANCFSTIAGKLVIGKNNYLYHQILCQTVCLCDIQNTLKYVFKKRINLGPILIVRQFRGYFEIKVNFLLLCIDCWP